MNDIHMKLPASRNCHSETQTLLAEHAVTARLHHKTIANREPTRADFRVSVPENFEEQVPDICRTTKTST